MDALFTIHGSTLSPGAMALDSDLFYTTSTYFRLPPGMKAKVWAKRIVSPTGAAVVNLEYSYDVTAGSPTWKPLMVEDLSGAGELILEKEKRPLVMRSFSQLSTEGFRLNCVSGVTVYTDLDVELSLAEDY
jgi:hypothetical protein